MIAPVLEEIADEYGDRLKVCKVDVDANPTYLGSLVCGIPTLIVFKAGSAVETKVGALSKTQLAEFVDSCLGAPPSHVKNFPSLCRRSAKAVLPFSLGRYLAPTPPVNAQQNQYAIALTSGIKRSISALVGATNYFQTP